MSKSDRFFVEFARIYVVPSPPFGFARSSSLSMNSVMTCESCFLWWTPGKLLSCLELNRGSCSGRCWSVEIEALLRGGRLVDRAAPTDIEFRFSIKLCCLGLAESIFSRVVYFSRRGGCELCALRSLESRWYFYFQVGFECIPCFSFSIDSGVDGFCRSIKQRSWLGYVKTGMFFCVRCPTNGWRIHVQLGHRFSAAFSSFLFNRTQVPSVFWSISWRWSCISLNILDRDIFGRSKSIFFWRDMFSLIFFTVRASFVILCRSGSWFWCLVSSILCNGKAVNSFDFFSSLLDKAYKIDVMTSDILLYSPNKYELTLFESFSSVRDVPRWSFDFFFGP